MEAKDDPRFLKGIDEFNEELFFECHETLEEIWLEDHGEDRKFYQGLSRSPRATSSCSKMFRPALSNCGARESKSSNPMARCFSASMSTR